MIIYRYDLSFMNLLTSWINVFRFLGGNVLKFSIPLVSDQPLLLIQSAELALKLGIGSVLI